MSQAAKGKREQGKDPMPLHKAEGTSPVLSPLNPCRRHPTAVRGGAQEGQSSKHVEKKQASQGWSYSSFTPVPATQQVIA